MNFCGTKLRKPTQEELDKIEKWMNENPQKTNESIEDYISRHYNETSVMRKWVYLPQNTKQTERNT